MPTRASPLANICRASSERVQGTIAIRLFFEDRLPRGELCKLPLEITQSCGVLLGYPDLVFAFGRTAGIDELIGGCGLCVQNLLLKRCLLSVLITTCGTKHALPSRRCAR